MGGDETTWTCSCSSKLRPVLIPTGRKSQFLGRCGAVKAEGGDGESKGLHEGKSETDLASASVCGIFC